MTGYVLCWELIVLVTERNGLPLACVSAAIAVVMVLVLMTGRVNLEKHPPEIWRDRFKLWK